MNPTNERLSVLATYAPDNFSVADAEAAECYGIDWPISGDATTIDQAYYPTGATK